MELSQILMAQQCHCEHTVSAAGVSNAPLCVCVCVRKCAWPVWWVSSSALLTSPLQEFRAHPRLNSEQNGTVVSDLAVLITEPD